MSCVWMLQRGRSGKEEGSSPVSAITERRDMGLYEMPLSMSLLGFGMRTMLANFHMLLLRAVVNMLVRNASPRVVIFSLFYCLLDLSRGECVVMSLYFCFALLMYLFVLFVACLTVFVNCLVKQFAMCVGVFAVLLLNVMDVFSVGGGALLDILCMVFHRMCVLCL